MVWQRKFKRQKATMPLVRGINILLSGLVISLFLLFLLGFSESVCSNERWTGRSIMDEVFKRHELFPYVYEEQTMILIDVAGNRIARMARRFSRIENDGTVKLLLVLDNPAEVRGVALRTILHSSGRRESNIYLPAFGKEIKSNVGKSGGSLLLGTDFAIEDLTAEVLSDFRYVRVADHKIDKIAYFVVEVFPRNEEIKQTSGYSLRRHFVRQDIFFIIRTDFYDRRGRLFKRQTNQDLKRVDGDMWRADMILMENHKERHKTLLKINKRVFSQDYVYPKIFTSAWLLENRHIQGKGGRFLQSTSRSFKENENYIQEADSAAPDIAGIIDSVNNN